jgi:hypothetical protein
MSLMNMSIKDTIRTIPNDVLSDILWHIEPENINLSLLTDANDKIGNFIRDNLARYWMSWLEEVSLTNPEDMSINKCIFSYNVSMHLFIPRTFKKWYWCLKFDLFLDKSRTKPDKI